MQYDFLEVADGRYMITVMTMIIWIYDEHAWSYLLHFRHTGQTDISPTMFNYTSLRLSNGVESVRFKSKVVRRFWTALPRPSRVTSVCSSCWNQNWFVFLSWARRLSKEEQLARRTWTNTAHATRLSNNGSLQRLDVSVRRVYTYIMIYRFKDESSTRASCIAVRYGVSKPFETLLPSCTGIICKPSSGSLLSNEYPISIPYRLCSFVWKTSGWGSHSVVTLRIGACDCDDVDAATYLVERRTVNVSWGKRWRTATVRNCIPENFAPQISNCWAKRQRLLNWSQSRFWTAVQKYPKMIWTHILNRKI